MTHWLVANPKAGDGQRGRQFWQERLARAGIVSPEPCDFDDTAWAERVKPGDVVMVAGGDGSVNRGAALCLQMGATLAVLPSGTANDFARSLGLPTDPDALCNLIYSGVTQQVDVADYGEGVFLNVAHIGLGSLPASESPGNIMKKLLGSFSYLVDLLMKINPRRGFRARVQCDEALIRGRWLSIAVANGGFFGGGSRVPQATADSGQLIVMAVRLRSVFRLLLTYLLVRLGWRSPDVDRTVVYLRGTKCQIDTRRPKTIAADGDVVGKTPLSVVCRPRCLSVISSGVAPAEG